MESIIIGIIVLIAVFLTARYIYKTFNGDKNPVCESCVYKSQCETANKKCDNFENATDK